MSESAPRTTWDATAYDRFGAHRARPVADLLARVGATSPRLVVDLGCGTGASTRPLADRWPYARVVGVDASPEMLEKARTTDQRIDWIQADLVTWDPPAPPDVVLTNAVLQWIPGHLDLVRDWVGRLAPGGWFALQVPGNAHTTSHTLMRELVAGMPEAEELLPQLLDKTGVGEPEDYAAALHAAGCVDVDAWETTYLHILDPDGRLENPVLEWMRGTGLRPLLGRLPAEREEAFLEQYAAGVAAAHPRTAMGVLMPFRRIFAVGRRR